MRRIVRGKRLGRRLVKIAGQPLFSRAARAARRRACRAAAVFGRVYVVSDPLQRLSMFAPISVRMTELFSPSRYACRRFDCVTTEDKRRSCAPHDDDIIVPGLKRRQQAPDLLQNVGNLGREPTLVVASDQRTADCTMP
jgi:hypothetical protein